jgi:hypothetical protein
LEFWVRRDGGGLYICFTVGLFLWLYFLFIYAFVHSFIFAGFVGPVVAEATFVNREEIPVHPIFRDPVSTLSGFVILWVVVDFFFFFFDE